MLLHIALVGRAVHERQYVMMTHSKRHRTCFCSGVEASVATVSDSGAAGAVTTESAPPAGRHLLPFDRLAVRSGLDRRRRRNDNQADVEADPLARGMGKAARAETLPLSLPGT